MKPAWWVALLIIGIVASSYLTYAGIGAAHANYAGGCSCGR